VNINCLLLGEIWLRKAYNRPRCC